MEEIIAALEAFETPGDFFAKTTLKTNLLDVKVNKVGLLNMPISKEQVQQLIDIAKRFELLRGHPESGRRPAVFFSNGNKLPAAFR